MGLLTLFGRNGPKKQFESTPIQIFYLKLLERLKKNNNLAIRCILPKGTVATFTSEEFQLTSYFFQKYI